MIESKISLENFRAYFEEVEITKRPLTINIGTNNCGKSTYTKFLEILKHSIPINLNNYGSEFNSLRTLHTFGQFSLGNKTEIINLNATTNTINFSISVAKHFIPKSLENKQVSIQFEYKIPITKTEIKTDNQVGESFITSAALPGQYQLNAMYVNIDNILLFGMEDTEEYFTINANPLIEESYKFLYINSQYIENLRAMAEETVFDQYEISKNKIELDDSVFNKTNLFLKIFETLNSNPTPKFTFLSEIAKSIKEYIEFIPKEIDSFNFVGLNRIPFGRKIDFSSNSLIQKGINNYFTVLGKRDFDKAMNKILPLFGLSDQLQIIPNSDYGFTVNIKDENGIYRNLNDYGSGIKQLLPLFLLSTIGTNKNLDKRIWTSDWNSHEITPTIFIEEPEVNLHPNFQSKLADLFNILNTESKINFVLETHSEYLVRRFQYLVGTKKIDPENIVINYFWKVDETTYCKQIYFLENGGLSDTFEKGFYDERLSLQLELLSLNNPN